MRGDGGLAQSRDCGGAGKWDMFPRHSCRPSAGSNNVGMRTGGRH